MNINLEKIRQRLLSENPSWGKYRHFYITDPKKRLISAASFEERIMHHAIMNVLEPVFERQMICHTYACRKNKGSHKAVFYAYNQCKKYPYVLKLDVRKYFDSINHAILKNLLRKIIKDTLCLNILDGIIDSYFVSDSPKCGLPIGNLTSQFFANYYLSALDHFILERLGGKCSLAYCRYMDDMLVFGMSKNTMLETVYSVRYFCLDYLKLSLKEPVITKTEKGVAFLGYCVSKNTIKLLKCKKKTKKKKIKKLEYLSETGIIDEETAATRMNAVCNVIHSGKTHY